MKKNFLFLLCMTLHILSFGQSDTWSVKFSDAILSRYQPTINAMTNKGWEYSNGIILHGMEKVYNWTNDVRYFNYIKAYVDTYVDASGNITGLGKTVDKIQPGVLCLFLYEKTGELKYKTAATNLVNYMYDNFYKTPDGGFWHKSEQNTTSYTYYHVMMVDGMYMLHPFLTKYAHMFNQPSLYDEATFQLLFLASKVMYSPRTLPKHAWEYYDYKTWSSSTTHESTDVWSRGTGWYIMALADVLEFLPTSHANYSAVLELFQRMASGVAANQHPTSGLWYQVVDKRTETGNWTESSGSGMFVYALKKGVDNGWLDAATYTPVINKGWEGMKTQIGTLADGPQIKQFCVASGVVNNTAAYYSLGKTNCPTSYPWSGTQHPHGYCGILMAASAMEFPIATVPVTGVILSPSSAILSVGETQQLTATVSPTNATNRAVTWSSSNTGVATVSSAGLVTGSGAGTAVITAKTSDGGFTAISTVTVTAVTPCTTIQNQAESGTYTSGTTVDSNYSGYTGTGFVNTPNTVGSYLQITVTALIAGTHDFNVRFANGTTTNRTVSVSVNGTTVIASLSMAGTGAWSTWSTSAFSASLVAGTNTIRFTALTSGGLANIDRVDMCQKYIPATGVLVSPASVTLTPGGKQQLTASVQPANASYPSVTWSSGNTGVATVNSSGLITAVTSGTTVITATTGNGLTSSAQVTVSSIPVTGVTVNPALTLLKVGDQSALTAIIEPANATNQNVTWNSSNTSVATVSSSGVVTALAEGTANITVTTADGNFTSVCPVTSYLIHITGISVTPSTAAITVGENITLTASVTPTDANNLNYTWSTSNNDIATVSSTGVVTGIAAGTAMITATTQDGGYTSNCEVTVSNIPVTGVNVSPATLTLNVGSSSTLISTAFPTNATNKSVVWSSENEGVAMVSASGIVTGIASGTTVITVTTSDGGYIATCDVTVTSSCTATGYITYEKWLRISGTAVSALTSNAKYPDSPSSTSTRTLFEIPVNSANSYGSRVSGYICAPLTGYYTFWIAGDDNAQLWLSTDNSEDNKEMIAYHTGYTSSRQWTKFSTQKSAAKYLVQGVSYYIEALHKEGTGNDNLAVGWLKPGQTGTVPSEVIPGSVLSPRSAGVKNATIPTPTDSHGRFSFGVYPNPAQNMVHISLPAEIIGKRAEISLITMNGQVVRQMIKNIVAEETIDLSSINSGLYIIRILSDQLPLQTVVSVVK